MIRPYIARTPPITIGIKLLNIIYGFSTARAQRPEPALALAQVAENAIAEAIPAYPAKQFDEV